MASKIYVGDIGVVFRVSTDIDLTTATTQTLKVTKPDGTVVSWTATVYGSAADGVLTYTTSGTDISTAGAYKLQAYVELGAAGVNGKFYGETVSFPVYAAYR